MEVYKILRKYRVHILTVGSQNAWYSTILHRSYRELPFIMLSNRLGIALRVVKVNNTTSYHYLLNDLYKLKGDIKSVVDSIE